MRRNFAIIGLLFFLPLILFWQQTMGGRTLLPAENLYQYEPYATYREVAGAPAIPHNHLLSDLVLQNMQWKVFIRQSIAQNEVPLWNPYQFSGIPFMAAGQQSTLYPLSVIYYILPLTDAYGWFTVVNLWLSGVFMYLLLQGLGVRRFGATISGITYQLSGMFIASAVHPMIIGAVVWLPLLLHMAEYIIQQRPLFHRPATVPWIVIGGLALSCNILAGHIEFTIYTLLIVAYYTALRLLLIWWQHRRESGALRQGIRQIIGLAAMVLIGLGLGAVQLVPLYEVVNESWRAGKADYDTVVGYAHPIRDVVQFVIPNFYGNPAHHTYFDIFEGQTKTINFVNVNGQTITNPEWGMKNYVEAALYIGILPLGLTLLAFLHRLKNSPPYKWIFGSLAVISLTFAFGLSTYVIVYALPGINQLNTPFRWIYAVTACIAVLAGFGADALSQQLKWSQRLGYGLIGIGILTLVGLLLSRLLYSQFEPLLNIALDALAAPNGETARSRFADADMFYSYQFVNVLIFGLMTVGAGLAFIAVRGDSTDKITLGRIFAVVLVAVDLMMASWAFNPASDPALLNYTPPAIAWLQEQPGDWRYTVINNGRSKLLEPNMTMRYGLHDVRGYDSIISQQYVDYMHTITPQSNLIYNQVTSPTFEDPNLETTLTSTAFNNLSIRYVITNEDAVLPEALTSSNPPAYENVYEDEAVRIWRNNNALSRACLLPITNVDNTPSPTAANCSILTIHSDNGREKFIDIETSTGSWVVLSESYALGWRAYLRPQGAGEEAEQLLAIWQASGNFQRVYINQPGDFTLRLVYSPTSFQVGVLGSVISSVLALLLIGWWLKRIVSREGSSEDGLSL